MKRIIIFFGLLSVYLFHSCESLELTPIDYFASGSFWTNTAQVNGNMLSLHNDLRATHQSVYFLGEARGGTHIQTTQTSLGTNVTNPLIKHNNLTKDGTGISNWYNYYPYIMKVNHFIEQVEDGCTFLSSADRGYFLGQAYGIRAYYYFMLYRTYGGVPIVEKVKVLEGITSASDLYTPRSTPKQTLDFIKSDIVKSNQYFASDFTINSNSLWSKSATLMLTAEIYLWSAKVTDGDQSPASTDLQTAKDALTQVIGKFSLLEKFSDLFAYTNKENAETIFAIRFREGEATCEMIDEMVYQQPLFINQVYSKEGNLMGDTLELRNLRGGFFTEYKFELLESYEPNDSRRDATFLDYYIHDTDGNIINKGMCLRKNIGMINAAGNRLFTTDIPRFRYAETLLMLAEVENKLGNDPSSYINEVRQRAYGTNYNPSIHAYSNSDFATNELAILHERDKEFVFEGKRWFDVRRMQDASGRPLVFSGTANYGTTTPILDYATEAFEVLWPVDVNTMVNDPTVEQTPGY